MKKAVKEQIKSYLKHCQTKKLDKIYEMLDGWDHNHRLKKGSWFWTDNGDASTRAYKEKKYTFRETCSIAGIKLHYWSDCSMSRANVYWTDEVYANDDSISVTFADIGYIIETIDGIRKARQERKARAAGASCAPA